MWLRYPKAADDSANIAFLRVVRMSFSTSAEHIWVTFPSSINEDPLSLDGAAQIKAFFEPLYMSGRSETEVRYQEVLHLQVHVGNYCTLKASKMLQKQLEFWKF